VLQLIALNRTEQGQSATTATAAHNRTQRIEAALSMAPYSGRHTSASVGTGSKRSPPLVVDAASSPRAESRRSPNAGGGAGVQNRATA
jgi:hypothetical protein